MSINQIASKIPTTNRIWLTAWAWVGFMSISFSVLSAIEFLKDHPQIWTTSFNGEKEDELKDWGDENKFRLAVNPSEC